MNASAVPDPAGLPGMDPAAIPFGRPVGPTVPSLSMPRLVIAAPSSGSGKTTVATGIIAALTRRGLTVSPHKVGPDYIDPGYHALAAGRPGRNLDPWLVGPTRVAPLFAHGFHTPGPADLAVVEGVMGLHDGMVGQGAFASTAHVAGLLQAPVVLVLDGRSMARTAAAIVLGLGMLEPRVHIGGVILNRVGSDRHEQILREAMAEIGAPVLGRLRRAEMVSAPSRHLGLVPVAERSREALASVEALEEMITEGVDLDALLDLARSAPPLPVTPWDPAVEVGGPVTTLAPRIAVASGPAFTFGYTETAELLTAAGAEVVGFDPLHDPVLPAECRGLVIGGGFPEVYAEQLAGNTVLRADIAGFGGPIVAECAGLLYLGESLDGVPMCARLPGRARMTSTLTLGYRQAVAASDSVVAARGTVVNGHEFHRTVTDPTAGEYPAWHWDGAGHGFVVGNVHASYLHTHWAGNPQAARRFVEACT